MKRIKFFVYISVSFLIGAAAYIIIGSLFNISSTSRISDHSILLKKIEEIGRLELVKFNFNDVVEESVKRKFLNVDHFAPDSRVLFVINGEAAGSIDLLKVKEDDINSTDSEIRISLPQPEISYVKVNHKHSKIHNVNFTAKMINPELIEEGFKNAEINMQNRAIELGILEKTRDNAVKMLTPLLASISGKRVVLVFE